MADAHHLQLALAAVSKPGFHYQEAITVLLGSLSLAMWSGSERKGYRVSTEEKHLPITASPLKGILERDRFSIKTHTRRRKGESMRARLSHQDYEPHRPPPACSEVRDSPGPEPRAWPD